MHKGGQSGPNTLRGNMERNGENRKTDRSAGISMDSLKEIARKRRARKQQICLTWDEHGPAQSPVAKIERKKIGDWVITHFGRDGTGKGGRGGKDRNVSISCCACLGGATQATPPLLSFSCAKATGSPCYFSLGMADTWS